jgi:hypothetical protein
MKTQLDIDDIGTKRWTLQSGDYHREDGPAVEYGNGGKYWYINGQKHREDGPAIENSGGKAWMINDKLHRVDGPAVEWCDGKENWWLEGIEYTKQEYRCKMRVVKIKMLL